MGKIKSKIHIPAIESKSSNPENDNRIIILMDDSYDGLNIEQVIFLKVVLESWINLQIGRD